MTRYATNEDSSVYQRMKETRTASDIWGRTVEWARACGGMSQQIKRKKKKKKKKILYLISAT
jgi:hypothetical protein